MKESADELLGLLERMTSIRRFEEEIQRRFIKGEIPGTTHLCVGQEAVPVGVASTLRDGDLTAATYRGHGTALALGVDRTAYAAEMMGRASGVCGGRSGSMNVIAREQGLLGSFGIIGGSIAAATGAALALRGTGNVAVAYFGDGTTNQGYFPECLNFAEVFKLPVLFVCEHNLYGEYTPWEDVTAGADLRARAEVYGIRADTVDGNDVGAVRAAAQALLEPARAGEGPSFLEARTYRQVGHSRSDPATYRPEGELEEWLGKDPLKKARAALGELGVTEEALDELDASVTAAVAESFATASAAPYPEPAVLARVEEYCNA